MQIRRRTKFHIPSFIFIKKQKKILWVSRKNGRGRMDMDMKFTHRFMDCPGRGKLLPKLALDSALKRFAMVLGC